MSLATTCTWTTLRWGRRRIWRRAWNSSPPQAHPPDCRHPAVGRRPGPGQCPGAVSGQGAERVGGGVRAYRGQYGPPPLAGQRRAGADPLCGAADGTRALSYAQEQAGAGHGQLVALVGEAGVGKSRLVYEFVHSHRTHDWLVLESASVSYGKATPYFPVLDLLKRYAHVEEHDDTRTIRAKVTGQVLTLDETLQDTIPALLALLDALPEDSPFLRLDPPQRRQRTLDGPQARAAARKPGAAAAAGLRRPALDRCGDAGPARQPGREPAHGPPAASGQLSSGVPAWLGHQDLLHATAARPAAPGEC